MPRGPNWMRRAPGGGVPAVSVGIGGATPRPKTHVLSEQAGVHRAKRRALGGVLGNHGVAIVIEKRLPERVGDHHANQRTRGVRSRSCQIEILRQQSRILLHLAVRRRPQPRCGDAR